MAATHLGVHVTSRGIQRTLGRLERNGKGLLPTLARELGAREFLLKPLRSREIRSLIERHTGAQLRPMSEDGDP